MLAHLHILPPPPPSPLPVHSNTDAAAAVAPLRLAKARRHFVATAAGFANSRPTTKAMYYHSHVARVNAEMVRPNVAKAESGDCAGTFDCQKLRIAGLARTIQSRHGRLPF